MKKIIAIIATITLTTICQASELTFSFGNPSFSGEGYSSHVLSISQLEYNRKEAVKDDLIAAQKAADREAKNTTLAKFVTNVESRIFANLSKQMVDNMFGTNCTPDDPDLEATLPDKDKQCPLSGSATLPDGATVVWAKDTTAETITLTVTDAAGSITQLIVPVGDFKF